MNLEKYLTTKVCWRKFVGSGLKASLGLHSKLEPSLGYRNPCLKRKKEEKKLHVLHYPSLHLSNWARDYKKGEGKGGRPGSRDRNSRREERGREGEERSKSLQASIYNLSQSFMSNQEMDKVTAAILNLSRSCGGGSKSIATH